MQDSLIPQIILASSSPRRRELLSDVGMIFTIVSPDCDESILPEEGPEEMVKRLALAKAKVVSARFPEACVIGADTTVFLDREILGKPLNADEATRMLQKLSGRPHQVWGGVAVVCAQRNFESVQAHQTVVQMAQISERLISWYVATGEPFDKAGSYAIQGLGSQFVESVSGSYSNVVGLNIPALMQTLRSQGYVAD